VNLPTGETFTLERNLLWRSKFKIYNEQQTLLESRTVGWLFSRHHQIWFEGAMHGQWRYLKSSIAGSSYQNELLGFEVESGGGQKYVIKQRRASADLIESLVNPVYEVNAGVNQYLAKVAVSNGGGQLSVKVDFEMNNHLWVQVFAAARLWLDYYDQLALS